MRTKRIKLYSFEELSTEAQVKAIDNYQHRQDERHDLINFLRSSKIEFMQDGTLYTG